jgi:hypothetical protein
MWVSSPLSPTPVHPISPLYTYSILISIYKRIMNNALILAGDPQNLNILYIALSEYKIRLSSLPKASYVLEHLEVVDSLLRQIDNISLPAD